MSTVGLPLFEGSTSKSDYGAPVFSQWRVAIDAYGQMVAFLKMEPEHALFTEADRESIECDLQRLAQAIGQMDAGQKGGGVSFDEVPHIMARISVACMRMKLSGALDRLEVGDGLVQQLGQQSPA